MQIWNVADTSPQDRGRRLDEAVRHLAAGGLVVVPTETVYGLAADATSGAAVARIYEAKGRPRFNPLISHVADRTMADLHGRFDMMAKSLADAFWPGPLTLVVPKRASSTIADLATAGLDTVALRWPDARATCEIIAALGRPIAAPSANRSGRVSPTTAKAAIEELGGSVAMVVDAGPCRVGLESTIVACLGGAATLLRPGGVPSGDIETVLGSRLERAGAAGDRPSAPGMLASHYAPRAAVRLNADRVDPGEAVLVFGPVLPEGAENAVAMVNLSESADLVEAAAGLFAALRRLDASGASVIAVSPIPESGLGEAINDRLGRAAAPRG